MGVGALSLLYSCNSTEQLLIITAWSGSYNACLHVIHINMVFPCMSNRALNLGYLQKEVGNRQRTLSRLNCPILISNIGPNFFNFLGMSKSIKYVIAIHVYVTDIDIESINILYITGI